MATYKDFNLKDDPFATAPSKDIVWADRGDFVRQLKDAIKHSLLSSPSRIVATIWGDWGAGKTHAKCYFSQPEVMRTIMEELKLKMRPPISIPITFPLGNIADTVYLEIVEQIGVDLIIKALNALEPKSEAVVQSTKPILEKASEIMDPRVAEAFVALKGKKPFLFQRYLSMTASSAELKNSGVARGIETSSDKTRTISGILNLLTTTIASRIFLWFDDLERIGDMPTKDVYGFQYLIRDLLDNVPSNLVIIFNMTMLPDERVEDRLLFLGDAIRYRISDTISVKPFTEEELCTYVRDLLSHYRLKVMKKEEALFPFEESSLKFIFSELKRRAIPIEPRNVNAVLSSALFQAAKDTTKTDLIIKKSYFETHITEILARISLPKRPKT